MSDDAFFLEIRQDFINEAKDLLNTVGERFIDLEKNSEDKGILDEIMRVFHNIKGGAKTAGLVDLATFSHKTEDLLVKIRDRVVIFNPRVNDALLACTDVLKEALKLAESQKEFGSLFEEMTVQIAAIISGTTDPGQPVVEKSSDAKAINETTNNEKSKKTSEEAIKLSVKRVQNLLDGFGEQVILQSKLAHLLRADNKNIDEIITTLSQLEKITFDLQQTVITLRMISLSSTFNRLERTVRDVARISNKKIEFIKIGSETELDKRIADSLIDPLNHMVRNSVDHGIETVEDRLKSGKTEVGKITLSAYRQGGSFFLEVQDDGKGLDPDRIFAKAVEKGIVKKEAVMSKTEILDLIFQSGFSTKEQVSEISGRGVGMDVVREMFRRLKGSCKIESEVGKGSKFTIRLPLTMALFNGTLISVSNEKFILPNSDYTSTSVVSFKSLNETSGGGALIQIHERIYPVVFLREALQLKGNKRKKQDSYIAAITSLGTKEYAVLFDELLSQEKVVLKKLGPEASNVGGVSGCTILGDGNVALVLELKELIESCEAQAG